LVDEWQLNGAPSLCIRYAAPLIIDTAEEIAQAQACFMSFAFMIFGDRSTSFFVSLSTSTGTTKTLRSANSFAGFVTHGKLKNE
jgi:hypothetical protein